MGKAVSIRKAKNELYSLIAAGEEVAITRAGKLVAKLVPMRDRKARARRRNLAGAMTGKIKIGPDFDERLPDDMLTAFNGQQL